MEDSRTIKGYILYRNMASYTGGAAEKARVAKLQKQREKGRAEVCYRAYLFLFWIAYMC